MGAVRSLSPRLLVVCPNLCLDRIVVVRDFAAGHIHLAESTASLASGKGLNVARAARVLGGQATVVGVIGTDDAGRSIVREARHHGIRLRAVRVAGSTRVCTLIVDPDREETVVNERGPAVDASGALLLMEAIRDSLDRAHAVVVAGSLPPGLPGDFYAQTIRAVREARGVRILLDATGEPLHQGLAARPDIVKINRTELGGATSRSLSSTEHLLQAAGQLGAEFGSAVVVTMGADGAALVTTEGRWLLAAPPAPRVNTIGAGDSLTAGLMVGLLTGSGLLDAVKQGMASAAADVATLLPGTIDLAQVRTLLPLVTVRPV